MFTVCPKCALTLVVTAADLRVAQGYVRCGRCSNVFNALARLSDDRQSGSSAGAQGRSSPRETLGPLPSDGSSTAKARQLLDEAVHPEEPARSGMSAGSAEAARAPEAAKS